MHHARIQRNSKYFPKLEDWLPKMPLRSRKPWDVVSPPTSLLPARGLAGAEASTVDRCVCPAIL